MRNAVLQINNSTIAKLKYIIIMKLELNFFTNSDGDPCVAVTSPNVENGIVKEMYCEDYDSIVNTLSDPDASQEDLMTVIQLLAEDFCEDNVEESLHLHVTRHKHEDGSNHCGIQAVIGEGKEGIVSCSMTGISNNAYKKFCKGSTMQKLNIAYHAFEDEIKSGIFDH